MKHYTAGVDEVGRGSLAGPVVACAVILPPGYINAKIKDSKKLSAKKREEAAKEIEAAAVSIGLGVVCSRLIDKVGIVHATKQAMHLAISELTVSCRRIIIDALALKNLPCGFIAPYKAEDQYVCVAAASIIAKVYRDGLMDRLSEGYPAYQWEQNKGYGTSSHIRAIRANGATPLHRKLFIRSYV